jgi:integrase
MAIQRRVTSKGEVRYLAKVFRGRDANGKRLEVFQTFSTLTQARQWERAQKRALDTGTFVEPSRARLGDYLSSWLHGAAKMSVTERTHEDYGKLLTRYVLDSEVSAIPLAKLTTEALESFYSALLSRPLSPRTVRLVHSIIRAALGKAARDRRIAANPAVGATLPREADREIHPLDRDQLARLLATSEQTASRWHALWMVLAFGGLRPSEALGLPWPNIGTDRVSVGQVLVRLKSGGWRLKPGPKNRSSRRTVTLPVPVMLALDAHQAKQEIEKIAAGSRYSDHGLVFAGQHGQPLDLKNLTSRHFVPLLKRAGLPRIRLYDLRHTHATLMLSAGVPVKVVSERLGHASAKMTLDVYGHVLPGQQEDAVSRLEAYMAAGAG